MLGARPDKSLIFIKQIFIKHSPMYASTPPEGKWMQPGKAAKNIALRRPFIERV